MAQDMHGNTALDYAARRGVLSHVEFLCSLPSITSAHKEHALFISVSANGTGFFTPLSFYFLVQNAYLVILYSCRCTLNSTFCHCVDFVCAIFGSSDAFRAFATHAILRRIRKSQRLEVLNDLRRRKGYGRRLFGP